MLNSLNAAITYAFMDYFQALFSRYEYSVNMHRCLVLSSAKADGSGSSIVIKQKVYVRKVIQLFKSALYFSERLKEELRANLKKQVWKLSRNTTPALLTPTLFNLK